MFKPKVKIQNKKSIIETAHETEKNVIIHEQHKTAGKCLHNTTHTTPWHCLHFTTHYCREVFTQYHLLHGSVYTITLTAW